MRIQPLSFCLLIPYTFMSLLFEPVVKAGLCDHDHVKKLGSTVCHIETGEDVGGIAVGEYYNSSRSLRIFD